MSGRVLRLLFLCAAALAGALPARAEAPEPLAISYVPGNSTGWDINVATEKGFFADEGFAAQGVTLQSAVQSAQLMVTNAVQMAVAQSVALLSAITHGSAETAIIAAPADQPDWTLSVRPEIKTAADLKGKLVGTAALQAGETWLARSWIIAHGLPQSEWGMIVVGTSAGKFAALQRGSIAATILFQPFGLVAEAAGYPTLYNFSAGQRMPPVLYAVNRRWAAENRHGLRLAAALVRAHRWLFDPANREAAFVLHEKYSKRPRSITEAEYDLFIAKGKLENDDAAVEIAGVDNIIALMVANGALPPGTRISPDQYMLPKQLGGLYH